MIRIDVDRQSLACLKLEDFKLREMTEVYEVTGEEGVYIGPLCFLDSPAAAETYINSLNQKDCVGHTQVWVVTDEKTFFVLRRDGWMVG